MRARLGARWLSASITIAPSVAAVLTYVAIQGSTLTKTTANPAAQHSRTGAVASKFTIRPTQLPEIVANVPIYPAAHPKIAPDFPAAISHLAMHAVARSGIRRLRQASYSKQTPQCNGQKAAANHFPETHMRPPFGLHPSLVLSV
jgi:hypothetical protein